MENADIEVSAKTVCPTLVAVIVVIATLASAVYLMFSMIEPTSGTSSRETIEVIPTLLISAPVSFRPLTKCSSSTPPK